MLMEVVLNAVTFAGGAVGTGRPGKNAKEFVNYSGT